MKISYISDNHFSRNTVLSRFHYLRPGANGRHLAWDIFTIIFLIVLFWFKSNWNLFLIIHLIINDNNFQWAATTDDKTRVARDRTIPYCDSFRFSDRHDDVIKWKHVPRYWHFVWGIHQSPVNSTKIPRTKASDAELYWLLWSAPE